MTRENEEGEVRNENGENEVRSENGSGHDESDRESGSNDAPRSEAGRDEPLAEARSVTKRFGSVVALEEASMTIEAGTVTCLLGDNGAGKSTLIGIVAGVHPPDEGEVRVRGEPVTIDSPRDARSMGIATVYQDLALLPLMSVWRNFFLGSEPTVGWGPFRRIDVDTCRATAREQVEEIGVEIPEPDRPVGTLSGGERQSLAISRALYFGADVLILDEPTAALGVKQTRKVVDAIETARDRGAGVVFVTHDPHQAYPVGDRFVVLRQGRVVADTSADEVSRDRLTELMAGEE